MRTSRRDLLRGFGSVWGGAMLSKPVRLHGAEQGKRPIRIGQIGVGHPHAGKLSVFRNSPDFEVVGVVEPDLELRRRAQSQEPYRDLRWMTQEELLNAPDLEAVLVETRVRDLLDAAEACLAADKHIHLDKPAGVSLPQFRRVLDEAGRRKRIVQMGYMYRYNPGVTLLRQFLAQGWLGEIFEVQAVMSKVYPPAQRQTIAEFSGGVMFDLGGHLVDLVVSILGRPDSVRPFNRHSSPMDDALTDNMLSVLTYTRATATIRSTALEVDGGQRRQLTVCGTEGTFHIQPLDDPQAKISLSSPRGEFKTGTQQIALPPYTRYIDDAADLARMIRGEKMPEFTSDHDLAVQETLLRACEMPLD